VLDRLAAAVRARRQSARAADEAVGSAA